MARVSFDEVEAWMERREIRPVDAAREFGVTTQTFNGWRKRGQVSADESDRVRGIMMGAAPSQPVGLDIDKLADLIETVESAVIQSGRPLPPRTKARILARLYARDQASATSSPEAVREALASLLEALE